MEAAREEVQRAYKLLENSTQKLEQTQGLIKELETNMRDSTGPGKLFNVLDLQRTRQYLQSQESCLETQQQEYLHHKRLTQELVSVLVQKKVDVELFDKAQQRLQARSDKEERLKQIKSLDELWLLKRGSHVK